MLGIDIASVDGVTVDWAKLAEAGYTFAIPRAEYKTWQDKDYRKHIDGARDAGLIVGGYAFPDWSQPIEPQAERLFSILGDLGPGYLPPTLDLERLDGQTPAEVVTKATKWGEMAKARYGVPSILYTSARVCHEELHDFDLSPLVPLFELWLAYYREPPAMPPVPKQWGGLYLIHQFAGDASWIAAVHGGRCDLDRWCATRDTPREWSERLWSSRAVQP